MASSAASAASEEGPTAAHSRLLPLLPDEISAECIARVPRFYHRNLALVSRSWRSLFKSSLLFTVRSDIGTARNFLCVNVRTLSAPSKWYLLDRYRRNPRPFLPLPSPPFPVIGSVCTALGSQIFVIGGSVNGGATTVVQVFDARFNRWELGPRMDACRKFAAAGTVGGRIYVFGGCPPSTDAWAEVLDPSDGGGWAPLASPTNLRESWMHGSAVLDGKILAVADRGGLLFDPATAAWDSVSTVLDLGWKGRAAAVDGIIYSYDFLGKIKGYDPMVDAWREVEGLEELPKFLSGATMADLGGRLCVVWEGNSVRGLKEMEIMCAEIEVSKKGGGLRGSIVWTEAAVLAVPKGSTVCHSLAVHL